MERLPLNDMELIKRYAFHADGTVYGMKAFQRMKEEAEAKFRASGGTGPLPPPPPFYWFADLTI